MKLKDLPPHVRAKAQALLDAAGGARRNKYNARRVNIDGWWFDSQAEADRYEQLKLAREFGDVSWFLCQVPFRLPGRTKYIADFLIVFSNGDVRVEDVKGQRTPMYALKRRQVQEIYGITIEEV